MRKRFLYAVLGVIAALVLIAGAVGALPARAATGCTCPTGCDTRTVQNAPFSLSGAGEYCIESTNLGAYIQSWGADIVNITGVDYTNLYASSDTILRDTTGKFFVYYKAGANGNFGTNGTSTITSCTAAWCNCAQYGQMNFGEFTVFNNAWGSADGTGQCIQANGPANWSVNATFPETGGVKTYPNSSLDLNGKTISTLGSCTSSYDVTIPATGSWETAYDLWVPSEIMIWMNQNGLVGPIASSWNDDGTAVKSASNITVGGHTWDVYHGGSNVISFVRVGGGLTNATVDILPMLNWAVSQGWISNSTNLGKFQFGFEITSAPGGLPFKLNNYSINCGGKGGAVISPTNTPVKTATPGPSLTPSITTTRSATPAVTNTPTRTPTAGITNTLTRTATVGITNTPTRTSTVGPTSTRTNTPVPPTITPTQPIAISCTPVTSTITAPFTFDGAGAFCWQSSNLGAYVNSWNTTSVSINGANYTNVYVAAGSYPAKVGGYWYVSYNSSVSYGHFEAK